MILEDEMAVANSLTASQMLEYLYCPRFTYFEYVLDIPQQEGDRFKVAKGRNVHEKARKQNPDYLRKKVGVKEKISDVYLRSHEREIRGIVDEVLFFEDGTAAPLDYKFAEYKDRIFKTYRNQLVFYARLIRENYNVHVNKGFIVYTRSKNKLVEVEITEKHYKELDKILSNLRDIIDACKYPKPTTVKRRCRDCCYKNICESTI